MHYVIKMFDNSHSCDKIIDNLAQQLHIEAGSLEAAEQEAWWLLEHVTAQSRVVLLTQQQIILSRDQQAVLNAMVKDRVEHHKPLQYILGSVQFCGIEIKVKPPVLIPRPETEEWVLWLIDTIKKTRLNQQPALSILDLCTGSGCIGLALAHAFPHFTIIGVDIRSEAIALARENAHLLGITNCMFLEGSLYDPLLPGKVFDIVVANPPYISFENFATLPPSVKHWEDERALLADDHGMALYEKILQGAVGVVQLSKNSTDALPKIVLEIGTDQRLEVIEDKAAQYGWKHVCLHTDLAGKPRWITVS